ncbi:hypothetical protein [Pseudoflavonifractor phocaeensis]|uniref:hypothetical protein n=1 Tax=Pseudoflavonifractor phocaeensis TaxID=1870988 RepID=UPI00195F0956|nr:hypothetical protein [Pseudoflavonifractor phocaeensis]MBM6870811.1 hypothetical protein [Pseudoflavonifractor phocaeensis]
MSSSSRRIRGITVEIGGDTTKLDKALSGSNKVLGETQKALKDVERLLKLDPGNTELLAQKQRLLAQAAQATAEKLDTLRQAARGADDALRRGQAFEERYQPLRAELDRVTASMRGLEANAASMEARLKEGSISAEQYEAFAQTLEEAKTKSEELRKAMEDVEKEFAGAKLDQGQYDALQRELAETAKELEDLEQQAKDSADGMDKLKDATQKVSTSAGKVKDAFAPVTGAVAALATAAVATVPGTEDLRAGLSKMDESARASSIGLDEAREAFENFYIVAGETDSAIEATANLLQTGLEGNRLQAAVEGLAGAVIRFPDTLNIESLADSLQETIATGTATGQFSELLDRLGIGAENFSAQLAQCTNEIGRQDMALGALAQGGLMQSYESWMQNNEALAENRQATLDMELEMAKLAESIQPLLTTVTEMLQGLLDWFNSLSEGGQTAVVAFLLLAGAISPVAGIVEAMMKVLPVFIGLLGTTGTKVAAIAVAIVVIASLIGAVVSAWDDMSGWQKAISVIGLVTVALFGAALAMGVFKSATGGLIAALAVAAGITAVMVAVTTAQKAQSQMSKTTVPGLAQGGLVPPGDPFFAVLGDNKKEVEVVSPYSTIKQAAGEAVRENLPARQGGTSTANLYLDGTKVGRAIFPYIQGEATRQGVRLIEGGGVW